MIKSWQERVEHGFSIYAKASALECEIAELRAENEQLREQNTNVDTACAELEKEVERLKEELRHTQQDCQIEVATVEALRAEVERLKQEQEEAEETIRILNAELSEFHKPKQEQSEPAAYFQLVHFGNSLIHEQVVIHSKEDEDVFPLYAAPQGQTELLRQALEALESFKLPEDSIIAAQAGNLIMRVPMETVTLQAAAYSAIKQHLGEA